MMEPVPSPTPTSGETPITVKREWAIVGVFAALCVAAEIIGYFDNPADFRAGRRNFFSVLSGLTWWLGHGVWLSMDRRRRGLDVGCWRYGVLFFGPLAIWTYMILEYRARALYLIPLSLAIYAVMVLVVGVVVTLATEGWS